MMKETKIIIILWLYHDQSAIGLREGCLSEIVNHVGHILVS